MIEDECSNESHEDEDERSVHAIIAEERVHRYIISRGLADLHALHVARRALDGCGVCNKLPRLRYERPNQ
jgi:hypothetical protein